MNHFALRLTLLAAAFACPQLASGALVLSVESSVQSDLPLSPVDLTASANIDWAIWGLSEEPTVGNLLPDVARLGGSAIGPLTEIGGNSVTDFSNFSFGPSFDWSNGDLIPVGSGVPAAMVSSENGVGSGFTVDIAVDPSVREVVFYGQNFKSVGTFTATADGETVTADVDSDTPNIGGDTGSVFTIDVSVAAPTTLSLRWELTEENGNGLFENIGISAIGVSAVPEPTFALFGIVGTAIGIARCGRRSLALQTE